MERITCQRKIILDYLQGAASHPSAETVYSEVKERLPRISRGTIYRNLKNLAARGEIQEIPADVSRYDGDISPHAHFICRACGRIFDIFEACKNCSVLKVKKIKVGEIIHYQMYFYGYCKKCGDSAKKAGPARKPEKSCLPRLQKGN